MSRDEIEVNTEIRDDATIVRPQGEIDLSRSPSLRHHLDQAQDRGPGKLIVDLGEVPYMDSSGVATLVEAMQVARRRGSRLILCGMQERVKSIFEIARLDMVFTIVESMEDALAT
ncbi:MAG: STAS domain-containing protein [Planctomycetota bacterium]|jgi:anti-sigma B factor antagonist